MNATIALILTNENQYSTVPKVLTLKAFTVINNPENARIQTQPGTAANQNSI